MSANIAATLGAEAVVGALLSGTQVDGRVRIQKLLYLLKAVGVSELSGVSFRYHHYGPYSDVVSSALQILVGRGDVKEQREMFDEKWQRYSYTLKPGSDVPRVGRESETLVAAAAKEATEDWRALEAAATAAYFMRERQQDFDTAFETTVKLKPHASAWREQAMGVLQRLKVLESIQQA